MGSKYDEKNTHVINLEIKILLFVFIKLMELDQ